MGALPTSVFVRFASLLMYVRYELKHCVVDARLTLFCLFGFHVEYPVA